MSIISANTSCIQFQNLDQFETVNLFAKYGFEVHELNNSKLHLFTRSNSSNNCSSINCSSISGSSFNSSTIKSYSIYRSSISGSSINSYSSRFSIWNLFPSKLASNILQTMASITSDAPGGYDSLGRTYKSKEEMWKLEAGEEGDMQDCESSKKKEWYEKGIKYWQTVEPSVNGVLGGYGDVSGMDVAESGAFLQDVYGKKISEAALEQTKLVALDCGAGVGRVTKECLLNFFQEVDLVEPLEHFLDAARKKLDGIVVGKNNNRAVNFFCQSLEEFTPEKNRYDVIWVQWCIGHLTDRDFIHFFQRSKEGLKSGGIFVLKENIARTGFVVDKEDSSVTRSDAHFRDLFEQTGLKIIRTRLQRKFPSDLFQVRMYALTFENLKEKEKITEKTVVNPISTSKNTKKRRRAKNQPAVIR